MSLHPFLSWDQKVDMLARYNSEAARGIMHTPDWKERMAALQREFNAAQMRDLVEANSVSYSKVVQVPETPQRKRWWQR